MSVILSTGEGSASVHVGMPPLFPQEQNPPGAVHAGRYGQQAGGTHSTGMHSCNIYYYRHYLMIKIFSVLSGTRIRRSVFIGVPTREGWNMVQIPQQKRSRGNSLHCDFILKFDIASGRFWDFVCQLNVYCSKMESYPKIRLNRRSRVLSVLFLLPWMSRPMEFNSQRCSMRDHQTWAKWRE